MLLQCQPQHKCQLMLTKPNFSYHTKCVNKYRELFYDCPTQFFFFFFFSSSTNTLWNSFSSRYDYWRNLRSTEHTMCIILGVVEWMGGVGSYCKIGGVGYKTRWIKWVTLHTTQSFQGDSVLHAQTVTGHETSTTRTYLPASNAETWEISWCSCNGLVNIIMYTRAPLSGIQSLVHGA